MKHWTEGGLEEAREIDNMKHWTDGGLEVAREIDNMKHWTDGGLELYYILISCSELGVSLLPIKEPGSTDMLFHER